MIKKIKKSFLFLITLIFIVWVLAMVMVKEIYRPAGSPSGSVLVVHIEKGAGVDEISRILLEKKIVNKPNIFKAYVFLTGKAFKLQAGDYLLSPNFTVQEIADKLVRGSVVSHKITFLEGWSVSDIADYLEGKELINRSEFVQKIIEPPQVFTQEFSFLQDKPQRAGLEGYLFPDTYELNYGDTTEDIVRRVLLNFDSKLSSALKEELSKQNKSVFEILTMASMIEKEVWLKSDKKIVAGILWKRIKIGMPLQVDATITYFTGRSKVSINDTKINSPYNTYLYRGLPAGPISNPGLESIEAAIYPKESQYLYYLSTPQGETIFSRTFAEHLLAKAKYLR